MFQLGITGKWMNAIYDELRKIQFVKSCVTDCFWSYLATLFQLQRYRRLTWDDHHEKQMQRFRTDGDIRSQ
jgi:hypothetical protein